jgi:cysteine desulfurase / selenocysteine lyase
MHYLDYAATSAVRPPVVADAVHGFLARVGASPGRGGYGPAVESARICFRCRRSVAKVIGLPGDPGRIAFMLNATHGLNTALYGLLGPGDRVLVTPFDHNAVLRPVHLLARRREVEVVMVPGAPDGTVELDSLQALLDGARLLVVNAVSNVLGTRLPLAEMATMAHAAGAFVLVDAAQSAGHPGPSVAEQGGDLVAFTGHKGLLGPQGTGGLWVREGVRIDPLLCGGTGGDSSRREMPDAFPDRLEAGTPNTPGIAGLLAGCRYLQEEGMEGIHARTSALKQRLRDGLEQIDGVRVLSPPAPDGAAIVTLVADRVPPPELARRLEVEWGVMGRSGLHCAPEVHRLLGTEGTGAFRLSLGWASTEEDVDRAIAGVEAIAGREQVAVGGTIS